MRETTAKVGPAVADVCVWKAPERLNASCRLLCAALKVSLPQVARVLSEVYGDRMAAHGSAAEAESFPLQQKLLVCCLLLLIRSGKTKEVVLGKVGHFLHTHFILLVPTDSASMGLFQLHEVYSRLCARRQVSAVGQGECLSLCSLLESRGIFALKKAKEARLTKVEAWGQADDSLLLRVWHPRRNLHSGADLICVSCSLCACRCS